MNQNMNMQDMIRQGAFGASAPMQYNPYQGNIIPFGGYINNPNIQQSPYENMYMPQQNNQFVFQPINYGYQQTSYAGQQYDYYNPYGNTFSQQTTPYSYNNYDNYTPFYYSPVAYQQYQSEQIALFKMKYRIANTYLGNLIDEEYLDRLCNPHNPVNVKTPEQLEEEREANFINLCTNVFLGYVPEAESRAKREAYILNLMSYNLHKELDNHSLCQFLEEDLWKLQREFWIRDNINVNAGRNLSSTYDSNNFNELLRLHNSSSNPYISDLLNNSAYDNNLDDMELGMQMAFDKERRRKAILEGKVPEFISSDEVQARRHRFTQQLMEQVYRKGGNMNV